VGFVALVRPQEHWTEALVTVTNEQLLQCVICKKQLEPGLGVPWRGEVMCPRADWQACEERSLSR